MMDRELPTKSDPDPCSDFRELTDDGRLRHDSVSRTKLENENVRISFSKIQKMAECMA